MTRAEMKAAAKQQIKGNIGILFVISILTTLICCTTIGVLLAPAISVSLCAIYLNIVQGQKASVGDMFCRMNAFGKSL